MMSSEDYIRHPFENVIHSGIGEHLTMAATQQTAFIVIGEEDSAKRRQILDGARKVFMDLGFDGGSMGEIARAAGVSKGTLYVYFADKSRLFEAIVEDEALEKGKIAYNLDPARDA